MKGLKEADRLEAKFRAKMEERMRRKKARAGSEGEEKKKKVRAGSNEEEEKVLLDLPPRSRKLKCSAGPEAEGSKKKRKKVLVTLDKEYLKDLAKQYSFVRYEPLDTWGSRGRAREARDTIEIEVEVTDDEEDKV